MRSISKPIDKIDHISVLVPTRGRTKNLEIMLRSLAQTAVEKSLVDVWIYVDHDDPATQAFLEQRDPNESGIAVHTIIGDRPLSQGEICNHLCRQVNSNGGIYFSTCDDYRFVTKGWDRIVREGFRRYPDNILMAFPQDPTAAPGQATHMILGAEWVNGLGRYLTEFFPFWYDDAWIDDVATLIGRKVQLDFQMAPQGGKGKTPRMKNLIFWEKFFLDTLADRVDDAKKLLAKIDPDACVAFPEKGSRAHQILKHLALRRTKVDAQKLKEIESQLSDQGRFWSQMQTDYLPAVNYLLLENRAVSHLLKKINPLMAQGQYEKTNCLLDTLSHATRRMEMVGPLKEYVHNVIQAKMHSTESGSPIVQKQSVDVKTVDANCGSQDRLDRIIAPEILNDGLFHAIRRIASQDDVVTALEIGSSDGAGSTKAFLSGLTDKADKARLFCMELSEGRFQKLQERVGELSHVHCINASSISLKRYPSADEIAAFYHHSPSALNAYPLPQILQWLRDDEQYTAARDKDGDGIKKIKSQYGIDVFDMVLIDGSEFTGREELKDVYGATYILLDDIRGYKNFDNYHRLRIDANYELLEEDSALRNGYAVFKKKQAKTPIHFFTIVLNGEPFIRYHWDVFRQLPFEWHWHIIEGVADLKHDTAWSLTNGGRIDSDFFSNGLSVDGTSAYLDQIASEYPDQVTLYRKAKGKFWDGKREMVSAPLANLPDHCLLWQVDADEIWKVEQIRKVHDLFERHPDRTAAFFHCHFFVGPELLTTSPGAYSHNNAYEWIRVWRCRKGMQWKSHEPPCLMAKIDGRWVDTATLKPFTHKETEAAGLVFTHHAYSLERQVRFKESYYGYRNAVEKWRELQQARKLPLRLGDYLPWVNDHCQADHMDRPIIGKGVAPVRLDDIMGGGHSDRLGKDNGPRIVIDGVIFQLQANQSRGISRVWTNLIPELTRQMPSAKITILQRDGFPVPEKDADIRKVPAYQWNHTALLDQDDEMLRVVCRDLKAHVFISTYYTRAPGVTNLVMMHDMIPEKFGFDLTQPEWVAKQRSIETADAFICVSQTTRKDLVEAYPLVAQRPMTVVYNGLDPAFRTPSHQDIEKLRNHLDLNTPYVLMVGNRHGYKNGESALKALAQLEAADKPTVLCVGGETMSPAEARLRDQLDIRHAGSLDDRSLAAAYGGAMALLVPSKYEGFGLPVIEAMACGCPVIALESRAVAEIGSDAVCYADPGSAVGIAQALKKILTSRHRQAYIEKGYACAAKFDWQSSSRQLAAFIQSVQKRPSILLTAVVSTYNAAHFMNGCLADLENQSIADRMEIIVVDSASQQDEAAIVRDFQARQANIKYIRTPIRESVYQAWNRGIKFARGNYITNANTDDRHRQDAFEQMVRVLEADDKIALVYADVVKTRTANETFRDCTPTGFLRWPDWDRRALLEKGCFIGPQPVWRRKVHETYGYFDERYRISADYEFWLRISQTTEFYHFPKTLGLYLDREDSIEHSDSKLKQREDRDIISTYANASARGRIIGMAACRSTQNNLSKPDTSCTSKQKTGLPAERVVPAGQGTAQGEPIMQLKETILRSIENLIENDHKEAACWVMEKMLLDYPDSPELHSQRAAMAFEQGDMDKALHHFENAADLAPQNALIQRQVGDFFYVVEKNAQRALSQYEKVLAIVPDNGETLMLAGHLSMSLHQYQEARKYYEHVLQVDPENRDVQQFLDKLSDPPTASQANGMSVDELYASAQTKALNDDRQSAIQLLEQLLAKAPEHPQGHNDLGVLYYESGDMEKAQTHYEQASRLQPENEIFQKNLADFYWVALADPEKAMQQYVQALKLNPQDVESLLGCVQVCMALNKTEDAREFLEAALSIEPWNDNAIQLREQLENGTETVGPIKDSTDLYEQAKQKAASGDLEGAIHDLTQVLVHSPDESKYHNELGILYYEAGEKEKALASYEQAVRLEPSEHNYAKNLADYYLVEQGRVEDAMKLYLQVLESNPEDIEALMATGLVCTSIGHATDAKHFYDRVLELEPWNQDVQEAIENINKHVNLKEKQVERKTAAG